jgi:hypothetical protein
MADSPPSTPQKIRVLAEGDKWTVPLGDGKYSAPAGVNDAIQTAKRVARSKEISRIEVCDERGNVLETLDVDLPS